MRDEIGHSEALRLASETASPHPFAVHEYVVRPSYPGERGRLYPTGSIVEIRRPALRGGVAAPGGFVPVGMHPDVPEAAA